MKYIIEVEQIPGTELWKAKGFNTLIFDQYGLDHLEAYDEEVIKKKINNLVSVAIETERLRILNELTRRVKDGLI